MTAALSVGLCVAMTGPLSLVVAPVSDQRDLHTISTHPTGAPGPQPVAVTVNVTMQQPPPGWVVAQQPVRPGPLTPGNRPAAVTPPSTVTTTRTAPAPRAPRATVTVTVTAPADDGPVPRTSVQPGEVILGAPALSIETRAQIVAGAETALFPQAQGDVADDVAIWRNPEHPERSLILADNKSDSGGGVAVHGLDGGLLHYEATGKIGNIDLRTVVLGGRTVVLVGANDRTDDTLRFWALDPGTATLTPLDTGPAAAGMSTYGFCLGFDRTTARLYAVVTARDSGALEQYELRDGDGRIEATKVRTLDVGSTSEACVVDDVTGALYVAEERVGLWRYAVDPATGRQRTAVDQVTAGHLVPDVEGLTVVRRPDGPAILIASSQGDSTFAVYDADGPNTYRGSFTVTGNGSVDGATETDGLDAVPGSFGPGYPAGLLVVHDASNQAPAGDEEPASNLKLVRLDQIVVPSAPAAASR